MGQTYLFTSESVTEGHPDKLCDRISDAVLDACLDQDPSSRVACETAVTTGMVYLMGQLSTHASVDFSKVVRRTLREVGYTGREFGFDAESCVVSTALDRQSEDIDAGVSCSLERRQRDTDDTANMDFYETVGAGDQGMMFGYACDETESRMPAPIHYAHLLCRRMSEERKNGNLPALGPDGKSMVTMAYRDGKPVGISTIVLSSQHKPHISQEQLRQELMEQVIRPVIPQELLTHTDILVNPTGRFVKGGPSADTGLTGRKIIVDTYGGMGRHGGGAFSGKDATKVDRTGAYAARYVAKNMVAAGAAARCEVEIAYAIGVARPVSVHVETFGTGVYSDQALVEAVRELFDLRPGRLIDLFGLRSPIFTPLSAYGHFGRDDLELPWERTDKAEDIRAFLQEYSHTRSR